jgi:hypothetical protein
LPWFHLDFSAFGRSALDVFEELESRSDWTKPAAYLLLIDAPETALRASRVLRLNGLGRVDKWKRDSSDAGSFVLQSGNLSHAAVHVDP